jgi:hypothetical protein
VELFEGLMVEDLLNVHSFFGVEDQYFLEKIGIVLIDFL